MTVLGVFAARRQRQTVHVSIVQHFSEIQGMYKCDLLSKFDNFRISSNNIDKIAVILEINFGYEIC